MWASCAGVGARPASEPDFGRSPSIRPPSADGNVLRSEKSRDDSRLSRLTARATSSLSLNSRKSRAAHLPLCVNAVGLQLRTRSGFCETNSDAPRHVCRRTQIFDNKLVMCRNRLRTPWKNRSQPSEPHSRQPLAPAPESAAGQFALLPTHVAAGFRRPAPKRRAARVWRPSPTTRVGDAFPAPKIMLVAAVSPQGATQVIDSVR